MYEMLKIDAGNHVEYSENYQSCYHTKNDMIVFVQLPPFSKLEMNFLDKNKVYLCIFIEVVDRFTFYQCDLNIIVNGFVVSER